MKSRWQGWALALVLSTVALAACGGFNDAEIEPQFQEVDKWFTLTAELRDPNLVSAASGRLQLKISATGERGFSLRTRA
jgi:hypothetical protein